MADKLLVISADPDLLSQLRPAIERSTLPGEISVIEHYPSRAEIADLLVPGPDRVAGVIVDFLEREEALPIVRACVDEDPSVVVAVFDGESDPEGMLEALQAGACEFLVPPFDLKHLERRFEKTVGSEQGRGDSLVCFMPVQGGNGASTIAIHVAHAISSLLRPDEGGKKLGPGDSPTLLTEFDFHSGTLAFRLRISPEHSLTEAFERPDIVDELWVQLVTPWNGVDLLPGALSGQSISVEAMQYVPAVFDSACRHYPYVVVDLPTALYSSSRDVLTFADKVYLVCTPEVMSLHLARRRIKDLVEGGVPEENILLLLNRDGAKGALPSRDIEEAVGRPVHARFPNDYPSVTDAYLKGGLLSPASQLGGCMLALAREIVGIEKEEPTKQGSNWKKFLRFD